MSIIYVKTNINQDLMIMDWIIKCVRLWNLYLIYVEHFNAPVFMHCACIYLSDRIYKADVLTQHQLHNSHMLFIFTMFPINWLDKVSEKFFLINVCEYYFYNFFLLLLLVCLKNHINISFNFICTLIALYFEI